ncbi:TIGR04104 family putative zinc finger protein [Metaplanococcus flavidus]|uniref:TIGR04104 family putative zinc finger protein n=1 Tax=Metaplanococcus flavidus TaxID=569883 RepID=A0ABW3L8P2_9BACL
MPHCENCNHQWAWGTALRKSFTLGEGMECPECGRTQYLTKQSKKRMGIANFFPAPILIFSGMLFDVDIATILALALVLFAAFMMTYPYMMELTDENEPMW